MLVALLVFLVVAGRCIGVYAGAISALPATMEQPQARAAPARGRARRRSRRTTRSRGHAAGRGAAAAARPPASARRGRIAPGRLIEQSGMRTTPERVLLMSLALGACSAALAALMFVAAIRSRRSRGAARRWRCRSVWLHATAGRRASRSSRSSSRRRWTCCRAPSAPATRSRRRWAWSADELQAPVGPEFKKTFEQQNFGLPLRDALTSWPSACRSSTSGSSSRRC